MIVVAKFSNSLKSPKIIIIEADDWDVKQQTNEKKRSDKPTKRYDEVLLCDRKKHHLE